MRQPDFMIIGAMKSATSTLHEQLARQDGFFMCTPKEPYFFSDDPVYAKGIEWYVNLFADAQSSDICGESTTHYAKLPTYPKTIARIAKHVPDAKFVYVMRHPIDRLVSQYIHQWTEREIDRPIDEAIHAHPELIAYSKYTMQLQPYFAQFGQARVLPVFFDHLHTHPQIALERICRFLGYDGKPVWDNSDQQRNVSSERMRVNPLRDAIVNAPILSTIRTRLIPPSFRERVKALWRMEKRPELSADSILQLEQIFDADLAILGNWLGVELTCKNFRSVTRDRVWEWEKEREQ